MPYTGKRIGLRGAEVWLVAAVVVASANAAQPNLYRVTDLGVLTDLPGNTDAAMGGINSGGKIVASSAETGAYAAMLYGGAWTNLGTLGGSYSLGADVNDSVRVVGGSDTAAGLRAFLWTPGGTDGVLGNPQMKDLGTLGGPSSRAFAINNSGQVAGYSETSKSDYHAFRYSGGTMTDIGDLLGNKYSYSYGYSINEAGHIVGEARNASWFQVAFFYNGTTAVDMGTLSGGDHAVAYALNNADQVVGSSGTASGFDHAFLYAGGVMSDLGTLAGYNSYATAINNSNVIVGLAGVDPADDSNNHAFIYVGGSMVDLNTLLDASGSGWTLVQASDINDAGQIVGSGTYDGANHGFLLNPLPQITQQPTNLAVTCQANASFTVAAAPLPLSCQWYQGSPPAGLAIASATNFTLTFSNVTGLQSGSYYAVVANSLAGATSSVAALTILDTTPPTLSGCPGNLTNYVAPGASSAVVSWSNPTATDNCEGVVPVFASPTNGSAFNLGVTPVTCWANDSSHNTNTCTFSVAVLQAAPPTITGVRVQETNVVLSFTTQAAAHYTIECRQLLASGSWNTAMAGITGTGGIVTVTNVGGATVPTRFHRVRHTLP